jgi:hypothetical protein
MVEKPRRFLSIHLPTVGLPVFGLSGKFAGFTTTRFGSAGEGGSISMAPVVLPASEVIKAIDQAAAKQKATPAAPKK